MNEAFEELLKRQAEISDLSAAGALMGWDQHVNMPPGGAEARARQLATLGKLVHTKAIDPEIGRLLDNLKELEDSSPYDSFEASVIRVTRRKYERENRVPPEFAAEMAKHNSAGFAAWAKARPRNDFTGVLPYLSKNFELARELADFHPGHEHPLDALMEYHEYGLKASFVKELFSDLRTQLVPLVEAIAAKEPADDSCLKRTFPVKEQVDIGNRMITDFGYDFNRGRQDVSPHPFTTGFSIGDIRITTRYYDDYLPAGLFSTLHEAGHAMYEQGVSTELEGTALAIGASIGVHESQSRLWENRVGRSRTFWEYYYPDLRRTFPGTLDDITLDAFYKAINKVEPSLIRVNADEVTYDLHIMMRFDFEMGIIDEKIDIGELPVIWNDRMERDLGIRPPNDADGVMQDIHWFNSIIGYFQGYAMGNILSAQFYEKALEAHPEISEEIGQGKFDTLHNWLIDNIYQHGFKYTPLELIERVTGGPITIKPYMRYLKEKYGELYDL